MMSKKPRELESLADVADYLDTLTEAHGSPGADTVGLFRPICDEWRFARTQESLIRGTPPGPGGWRPMLLEEWPAPMWVIGPQDHYPHVVGARAEQAHRRRHFWAPPHYGMPNRVTDAATFAVRNTARGILATAVADAIEAAATSRRGRSLAAKELDAYRAVAAEAEPDAIDTAGMVAAAVAWPGTVAVPKNRNTRAQNVRAVPLTIAR